MGWEGPSFGAADTKQVALWGCSIGRAGQPFDSSRLVAHAGFPFVGSAGTLGLPRWGGSAHALGLFAALRPGLDFCSEAVDKGERRGWISFASVD